MVNDPQASIKKRSWWAPAIGVGLITALVGAAWLIMPGSEDSQRAVVGSMAAASERPATESKATANDSARPNPISKIQRLRRAAFALQVDEKWCAARDAWREVLAALGSSEGGTDLVSEANANLREVTKHCEPAGELTDHVELPEPAGDERPETVPEDDVVAFYPVGRIVHSLAFLNAKGTGVNDQWVFRGTAHFAYQYRVVVETKVVENRGTAVVFELDFKDVSQTRATSEQEIELRLPNSPVLDVVWNLMEQETLAGIPAYVIVAGVGKAWQMADPRLKRSLTSAHNLAKHCGFKLDDSDEVEVVSKLQELNGVRVRMEYVSGLGVTDVKVLDDKLFDPDDLTRLAYNSSPFVDYFVANAQGPQEKDDVVEVDVRDVGKMLLFGHDVEGHGSIRLRNAGAKNRRGESVVRLDVEGGEVAVQSPGGGVDHSGTVRPTSGAIWYSPQARLVRMARVSWTVNTKWVSRDHLLFGTEKVRDVKIESYYEANRIGRDEGSKP